MNKQRNYPFDRFINAFAGMAAADIFYGYMGHSPQGSLEFFSTLRDAEASRLPNNDISVKRKAPNGK